MSIEQHIPVRETTKMKANEKMKAVFPPSQQGSCPFCDCGLSFTNEEVDAIVDLGKRLDLSAAKVVKQALRAYQLQIIGEPDLEKSPHQ